jgi:hypothetical protein
MCQTPIGEHKFKNIEKNDPANLEFHVILAVGLRGNIQERLCVNYKFKPQNYITMEEYAAIYPEVSYMAQHEFPKQPRIDWLRKNCLSRFDIDVKDFKKIEQFRQNLRVTAIVTWDWISLEGLTLQVFSDLAASRDGRAFGDRRRTRRDPETGEVIPIDP